MNRRDFIQAGSLFGGGLLISFTVPQAKKLAGLGQAAVSTGFTPNAFLNISSDNNITVYLSHVEMGQGIWTTLPMLLADELDVDLSRIKVRHAGADKAYNHTVYGIQITGGSSSTWSEFDRYRNAGATARLLLTQAGANLAGVAIDKVRTDNGYIIAGDHRYSYGELADTAAKLPAPEKITLRTPDEWKYISKGAKRLDGTDKTNGAAKFGIDIQFPGLLTAVVIHAPVFGGKLQSFDASKAKAVPGVKQIVAIPTGVAVIADNYWAAVQGRKAVSVKWEDGPGVQLNTTTQIAAYKKLAATKGLVAQEKGDADKALAGAAKIVSAEYVFPYLAHAAMEPLNCTVRIDRDSCEIWTGTQLPGIDRDNVARVLNIPPEKIKINITFLGGGFGRRATPNSDFVVEAVHIAKACGKPLKMVWSREDDMKSGFYRPFFVHHVQVGLNAQGLPVSWKHNIAGQSIMAEAKMFGPPPAVDEASVEGVKGSPYIDEIPDHFVGLHTTKEVVPVLWFRSVGNTHTAYVMETVMDELAVAAGKDPVAYRRELLQKHPRHLAALNLVADKGGWKKDVPEGHFQGIAVHESFGSYVAILAEVSIQEGTVRVHKVDCAIDCGLAVNPDGVKAQMESGIIFGLTMALYGELTIEKGRLRQNNFYDYRIARMNESPVINVYIAESREKMGGAGECGVPPTAPAIANAIFAATGKRIYDLPIMNHSLKQQA